MGRRPTFQPIRRRAGAPMSSPAPRGRAAAPVHRLPKCRLCREHAANKTGSASTELPRDFDYLRRSCRNELRVTLCHRNPWEFDVITTSLSHADWEAGELRGGQRGPVMAVRPGVAATSESHVVLKGQRGRFRRCRTDFLPCAGYFVRYAVR